MRSPPSPTAPNADAVIDLSCKDVIEFLMAYLDEELPGPTRRAFEDHLKVCPSCVNYLESYRATVRLARASGRRDTIDPPPNRHVPEGLVRAVRAARQADRG